MGKSGVNNPRDRKNMSWDWHDFTVLCSVCLLLPFASEIDHQMYIAQGYLLPYHTGILLVSNEPDCLMQDTISGCGHWQKFQIEVSVSPR